MPSLLLVDDSDRRLDAEVGARARRLLCPGHEREEDCQVCRRVRAGLHPDLLAISPDGARIPVDAVRTAIAFSAGRPYEARHRVVTIARAELLGPEGANALLKSLEEPSDSLTWILTTSTPDSLLPTIRSRCHLIRLARRSPAELRAAFGKAGVSESDADELAAFGFSPEDDVDIEEARARRAKVLSALGSGTGSALLLLAEEIAEEALQRRMLASLLRDAAVLAGGAGREAIRHSGIADELASLAARYSPEALRRASTDLDLLGEDASRTRNMRLVCESVLLDLRQARVG
jgi:DNA polymerase-3 subunit delta'